MIEQKHNIYSTVQYIGEFKKSHGQPYIVEKAHRVKNNSYVYDIKSVNRPKGSKENRHAEELLSVEYKDLVKI